MDNLNLMMTYPYSEDWEFSTRLELIDLDKERIKDLATGNGFIISSAQNINSEIKNENGIYSHKFGQTLQDINPFAHKFKCRCGHTTSALYAGLKCELCGTEVKFVDDNFKCTGWIILQGNYHVIHPNIYRLISFFIGNTELLRILCIDSHKDQDGHEIEKQRSKSEPYSGIGMIEFYEKFDEIIEFYKNKRKGKLEYYYEIMKNRNIVFCQSIPVYTSLLRPYRIEDGMFSFEGTNATYNIMARLAANINNTKYKFTRKKKPKDQLLFDLQNKFNDLYNEVINIMAGKKGNIRTCFGGRVNFTSRSVITPPDSQLRIDEIGLSYYSLCGLLQQRIINILHKAYGMHYSDAYKFLTIDAAAKPHPIIYNIIEGIIKDSGGIPVLINRNPTISFGGILYVRVVKITNGFTMSLNLQTIKGLAADFDGDTMNILYIINEEFRKACEAVFSPRNNMYISKNDGMFNNTYNHQRDTIININTMIRLYRSHYNENIVNKIKSLKES